MSSVGLDPQNGVSSPLGLVPDHGPRGSKNGRLQTQWAVQNANKGSKMLGKHKNMGKGCKVHHQGQRSSFYYDGIAL